MQSRIAALLRVWGMFLFLRKRNIPQNHARPTCDQPKKEGHPADNGGLPFLFHGCFNPSLTSGISSSVTIWSSWVSFSWSSGENRWRIRPTTVLT